MRRSEHQLYLDNASTTGLAPEVLEEMLPYFSGQYGNASSIHGMGRAARVAVERAREQVAALFDAEPSEIAFTSGGTEADVWALRQSLRNGTRRKIITSPAEHHAVLNTCDALRREGMDLHLLDGTPNAAVDTEAVEAAMSDEVAMLSVMHANNETGILNPVVALADMARRYGALFHCDSVQTAGKLPLSSKRVPYDFAVASAHKLHGPKGVGALYIRRGVECEPLLTGGAQERGRRGGTENVAGIAGFGAAAGLALRAMNETLERWRVMHRTSVERLVSSLPGVIVHAGDDGLPTILSCSFPWSIFELDGETLLMNLDLEGMAASSGSACTAGSPEPSHVIRSMGYDLRTAAATVRMSYGRFTTADEALQGVETLVRVVQQMRERGAR
jgi:cysteine desulfurase